MTAAPTPPRPRTGRGRAGLRRAGLTLIEMLVATTVGLAILSAATALFVGQARAYLRVRGISAVQRDLRLGMALLPMDLRGASRGDGDFLALSDTAVELRATIGTSVLCEASGTNKTTLILPPPVTALGSFTAFYAAPQQGDTVKLLVRTAAGGSGDKWLTAAVGAGGLATAPASTAGRLCTGATAANPRRLLPITWATVPSQADLDSIKPGMPVRVLRRVRYALYQAGSGRWYLGYTERQANGAMSTREPIAGPFEAAASATRAGVRFAYYDTAGAAITAAAAATGAGRSSVGRVDITLRPRALVRAGAGRDSVVVRDSAVVRVALRNRL